MKIGQMAPGARFRFGWSGKTGRVLSQGAMGTRVQYDGGETITVKTQQAWGKAARTAEQTARTFVRPHTPEIISAAADVEHLSGNCIADGVEVGGGVIR